MNQKNRDQQDEINLAVFNNKLDNLTCTVNDIKKKMENEYITRAEFSPISKGFYGLITTVGVIVIGAVLALIIKR